MSDVSTSLNLKAWFKINIWLARYRSGISVLPTTSVETSGPDVAHNSSRNSTTSTTSRERMLDLVKKHCSVLLRNSTDTTICTSQDSEFPVDHSLSTRSMIMRWHHTGSLFSGRGAQKFRLLEVTGVYNPRWILDADLLPGSEVLPRLSPMTIDEPVSNQHF